MRKTLCASVFVLALCCPVLAGDIQNPPLARGDDHSTTSESQLSGSQTTDGLSCTGEAAPAADGVINGGEADGFTAAALNVLSAVLALF